MKKRIYLKKFTDADFDKYYGLVGNARVMVMITERAIPLNEARGIFKRLLENNELHESARKESGLNRITAIIDPVNVSSRKILINNGFQSDRIFEMDGFPTEMFSIKI